jgi:hypothetical protein
VYAECRYAECRGAKESAFNWRFALKFASVSLPLSTAEKFFAQNVFLLFSSQVKDMMDY